MLTLRKNIWRAKVKVSGRIPTMLCLTLFRDLNTNAMSLWGYVKESLLTNTDNSAILRLFVFVGAHGGRA